MLRGIFAILGIWVFIKLLPIIIAAIIGVALFTSAQSEQQQENKQRQGNKEYNIIKIGNQVWMSENLSYNAKGSKCYNNNPQNCTKYGRLYDWNTAKNVCPKGWHLPTRYEWDILVSYTGGSNIAGEKLKAKSSWKNGGNGTNYYGFSAIAYGYGASDGNFYNFGSYGYWWSSSENNANSAYFLSIDNNGNVFRNNLDKTLLFAVRCVKD
jgi:uncharacterized protein (TIGR02145 family)